MHSFRFGRLSRLAIYFAFLTAVPVAALPFAAMAQTYPPGAIPGAPPGAGLPPGQSAAGVGVRVDRLENRIRELTGQVEELQFKLQRMEQMLQKFQQDVDYRLQGAPPAQGRPSGQPQGQPQRRSEPAAPPVQQQAQIDEEPMDGPVEIAPGGATPGRGRRGDAFDPNANPAAPGAPRQLAGNNGPYQPSAPARRLPGGPLDAEPPAVDEDPNAPLDLSRPGAGRIARAPQPAPGYPTQGQPAQGQTTQGIPPVSIQSAGVLPGMPGQAVPNQAIPGQSGAGQSGLGQPGTGQPTTAQPQNRFQVAMAALKENRLDDAEQEFKAFIDQNPKSRSVPDAVFNIGQTYEKRGRHREAAEQYLRVTQEFDKSGRAAESMLRLGLSLEKLGAREQACATWQEAGRKYPLAPGYVRTGLERQMKRASC